MDTGDTASLVGWIAGVVETHHGERDIERCLWRNVVKCIVRHVVSSSSDTQVKGIHSFHAVQVDLS